MKSGFNPETDATQIKNCLKSINVNETILVNLLPHRSNAQRQKIRQYYKTMYGKVKNSTPFRYIKYLPKYAFHDIMCHVIIHHFVHFSANFSVLLQFSTYM